MFKVFLKAIKNCVFGHRVLEREREMLQGKADKAAEDSADQVTFSRPCSAKHAAAPFADRAVVFASFQSC